MGTSEVALLAFASIALGALGVGLLLRDLLISRPAVQGASLRRAPDAFDRPSGRGWFAKVDHGFDLLVLESGTELTSATVFLMLLATALLAGGIVWIYSNEPLSGVACAIAGMGLPLLWLAVLRNRRMNALREQLPQVLEMLARATRAGQSIEQAFSLVAHEAGGLLGQEFRRCEQQLAMGRGFDKALKSLAGRVRLLEMRILATTLIVQRQSGGHLSETLERMSGVIRDRINAQRQLKASTAAGRMSTIVVASIAPATLLFLVMFQRDHLNVLFDDTVGRLLVMIAVVLEAVGLLWVFSLLRREG